MSDATCCGHLPKKTLSFSFFVKAMESAKYWRWCPGTGLAVRGSAPMASQCPPAKRLQHRWGSDPRWLAVDEHLAQRPFGGCQCRDIERLFSDDGVVWPRRPRSLPSAALVETGNVGRESVPVLRGGVERDPAEFQPAGRRMNREPHPPACPGENWNDVNCGPTFCDAYEDMQKKHICYLEDVQCERMPMPGPVCLFFPKIVTPGNLRLPKR